MGLRASRTGAHDCATSRRREPRRPCPHRRGSSTRPSCDRRVLVHADGEMAVAMRAAHGSGNARIGEGIAGSVALDRHPAPFDDRPMPVLMISAAYDRRADAGDAPRCANKLVRRSHDGYLRVLGAKTERGRLPIAPHHPVIDQAPVRPAPEGCRLLHRLLPQHPRPALRSPRLQASRAMQPLRMRFPPAPRMLKTHLERFWSCPVAHRPRRPHATWMPRVIV